MVVKEGLENDEQYFNLAKEYAYWLSIDVFDGERVEIHLCDKSLKTLRVAIYLD